MTSDDRGKPGTDATALPSALWVLALAMLVIRSAEVFYVPIMPLYARLLDSAAPLFVVGLATSADRLGAVVITPVAGRWADRVGRRRPYLVGVGVTAAASMLGGFAVGVVDLVAYRLVSDIGYGVLTIAAMSCVSAASARVLVTMGCGEAYPAVPGLKRDDWPIDDPKGRPLEEVRRIRDEIRRRVEELLSAEKWRNSNVSART